MPRFKSKSTTLGERLADEKKHMEAAVNDAHRYLCEAAECELNAEKATNQADREAWKCLADDWKKLARAAAG